MAFIKKYKGDYSVSVFNQPLQLHPDQEKVRQSIHLAMQREGFNVQEWPALNSFVDAVIIQHGVRRIAALRELILDLAYEKQDLVFFKGLVTTDPLFMQLSEESEDLVLRIVGILSSLALNMINFTRRPLFARYYQLGLHSHSEQLLNIAGGMKNLPTACRNDVINTRFKCKQYTDYWEAFEEYRQFRDWCMTEKVEDPFGDRWLRVIYRLMKANVSDTKNTPWLPIELTLELLNDRNRFEKINLDETFMLECLLLDHYAKKIVLSHSVEHRWLAHLQQIVINIHKGLVDRHGKDLNRHHIVFISLLNAYGHAKLPEQSFELLDQMISLKIELNSASLAVIFDTCGMFERLSTGREIFGSTINSKRAFELMAKNVWDSWLECLCRCGALREATTSALSAMEAALQKREELMHHDALYAGTSSKFYSSYAIRSELEETHNDENPGRRMPSDQTDKRTMQARRFSSKGLSDCRPDVTTFNLLLGFAISKYNKFTLEIHGEILWRLNQTYPELLPLIDARLIVPPSHRR